MPKHKPTLILQRITKPEDSEPYGTFGILTYPFDMVPWCLTLELPWRNNERDISCIPAGKYDCFVPEDADIHTVFRLKAVPDRIRIKAHIGCTIDKTLGCILLGRAFGMVHEQPGVQYSRKACEMVIDRLGLGTTFYLEVRDFG